MAKKDFTAAENRDLFNDVPAANKDDRGGTPANSSQEIKNAHATGDGSFGRSESSLPDEEEPQEKPADNPY